MNILITGIHGFIGCNFVNSFKDKHTLFGLDIISPQKEGIVKTYSWNDLDQIRDIDIVIHLAGKAHDTKNQSTAQLYFDINTGLTQTIFDWFQKSSAKSFIFFSSVKAAADSVDGDILTEDVIPTPKGPYGESKIKAEEYLLHRMEKDPTKNVIILRPCMIHGPGNKGNLNLLYKVVSRGIPWPLGTFQNLRSFTSIDNLCFAIEGLMTKNVESGIYHIGDDEPVSTNDLIRLIAASVNKQPRVWHLPKELMEKSAQLGDLLHLPLNTQRLQKLTENYIVSNEKLKKALGIQRMPVSAKDGLLKTLNYFKN